jgi:RecB family exonuclease
VIGTGERHAELERVLEIVDDVWLEADFGIPALDDAWKQKAKEMLEKLYTRWPGKGEPVDVELDVRSDVGGVTWVGRIDRLEKTEQGLRVIDYKTGTSVPTIDEAAQSIQLAFYARAVQEDLGPVVAAEMWFPRYNSVSVTTRDLDIHRLPEVEERMETITRSITEEGWEPRVSRSCGRCGFRRSCPAWPEGRGAFLP